jgi:adenylyl- and sulfurtransferase ThiI
MVATVIDLSIDADALCQIAEDALEQGVASSMTEAIVVARHRIEMTVTRALDTAHGKAIERYAQSIKQYAQSITDAEVIPHITAAQADDMRRVLSKLGKRLRESDA